MRSDHTESSAAESPPVRAHPVDFPAQPVRIRMSSTHRMQRTYWSSAIRSSLSSLTVHGTRRDECTSWVPKKLTAKRPSKWLRRKIQTAIFWKGLKEWGRQTHCSKNQGAPGKEAQRQTAPDEQKAVCFLTIFNSLEIDRNC